MSKLYTYNPTNKIVDFSKLEESTTYFEKSLPKNPPNDCNFVTLLEDADCEVVTRLLFWLQTYFKSNKVCNLSRLQKVTNLFRKKAFRLQTGSTPIIYTDLQHFILKFKAVTKLQSFGVNIGVAKELLHF